MTTYFLVLLLSTTTGPYNVSTGAVVIPQATKIDCEAQVERYKKFAKLAFCVKGYVK